MFGCSIWTLTKYLEIKFDGNVRRMLLAVHYKSWKQYLIKKSSYAATCIHKLLTNHTSKTNNTRYSRSDERMDIPKLAKQQSLPLIRSVRALNVVKRTYEERGEIEMDIQANQENPWYDHDIFIFVCMRVCVCFLPIIVANDKIKLNIKDVKPLPLYIYI